MPKKTVQLASLAPGFYGVKMYLAPSAHLPDDFITKAYLEATGKEEVSNLYSGEQWDYPPRLKKDRAKLIDSLGGSNGVQDPFPIKA